MTVRWLEPVQARTPDDVWRLLDPDASRSPLNIEFRPQPVDGRPSVGVGRRHGAVLHEEGGDARTVVSALLPIGDIILFIGKIYIL
jgi:hypothetical protein